MNFRSDNVTGIAPAILAAIAAANTGTTTGYGDDPVTARVSARFAEIFEHDVAVFPVATGTAANALALACLSPPWGAIYCHEMAHVATDECGAPEFFTAGAKMIPLPGPDGRLSGETLAAQMGGRGGVHHVQPAAVSISQSSEAGTVYRPEEIAALAEVARRHGMALHMDGARFANAVAALGCAPADLTWRAGIDALSFGATKNGAMAAEAVIFFDPARAADLPYRRKRAGHLVSKMRFLSAQLEAYLSDDLWLANARRANAMAARLAQGLRPLSGVRLRFPAEANEVFAEMPEPAIRGLLAGGFEFYRWGGETDTCLRLVTAFDTGAEDVDAFIAAARRFCT